MKKCNLKVILVLISLVSTIISCKKSKSSNDRTINKVSVLEKKIVKEDNKTILQVCDFNKVDIQISLLEDDNKILYISIREKEKVIEQRLNLESFNELSSVNIKCNCDSGFQIIFSEKLGNNYQKIIHHFIKNNNSLFNLNTVYIYTSDRNEINLLYKQIKPIEISNYNALVPIQSTYKKIYNFSGFQEGKTPNIDDFFHEVQIHKGEKNILEIIANESVLGFLFENIALDESNLSKFNDMAYYLEQSGLYEEAIYILKKIVEEFPDRTVAYINLGDAYWGLGKKEKARQAYKTYVKQMKANGKEAKIPKQVLERVTNEN